jgi:hypothetical protein
MCSSRAAKSHDSVTSPCPTKRRKKVLVTVIAVNIETATPTKSVSEKPEIVFAPE